MGFKEILEQHIVENPERYIQPSLEEGGWCKFVKTEVTCKKTKKANPAQKNDKPKGQNKKKGRRGWLHSV